VASKGSTLIRAEVPEEGHRQNGASIRATSVSLSFAPWNLVAYADIAVELAKRLIIGFMS
jgi:hypothetical protein